MINNKLLKDLEHLINGSVDPSLFPYAKGNSIRIGSFIVRENKKGFFMIYDLSSNAQIAKTFCKTSAVALAKALSQGKSVGKNILEIDKDIQDVGAFLKEQLNLLTNRTSQQKENAPEKAQ